MEKIWLSQYPDEIPAEIDPAAYSSVADLFVASCEKYANKPALACLGAGLSYKQLLEKSRDFAAFLQSELKLNKGERIALILPNVMQYPVCFFGAMFAGLTVVNVNPLYTVRELVKQLADCEVETVVVLANFAHVLQHALPETKVSKVIVTEIGDLCGPVRDLFINYVARKLKKKISRWYIPNAMLFRRVMRKGRRLQLQEVAINGDDLALLQYTGGTTGVSKGAMLTHRNLVANVEQTAAWMGAKLVATEQVSLTILPLYHIFALTVCGLTFLKLGVLNILIPNPRDNDSIVAAIKKYQPTAFVGVNSLFNALLRSSSFKKLDFSALQLTVAGGMAVKTNVAEKWQQVTGCPILEGYGLTEAGPVVSMVPATQDKFVSSIGLPLPSTDVTIRDDSGNELPLGETGELCVKGPQVMRGYLNRPEETEVVFWPDGWLRTGDVAIMDDKGYLYIVDRKKDIIVTSGYNVYPNEIEEVISSHPMVAEVAVIGVGHSHAGEMVKAFIVCSDEALSKEKIIAYCRDRLTSYKVPKRIEFRTELPKSNVGKILRRALRGEG